MKKFWAVWREGGQGAATKQHATKESAIAEAHRLATQQVASYYILEVIGIIAPPPMQPAQFTEL